MCERLEILQDVDNAMFEQVMIILKETAKGAVKVLDDQTAPTGRDLGLGR